MNRFLFQGRWFSGTAAIWYALLFAACVVSGTLARVELRIDERNGLDIGPWLALTAAGIAAFCVIPIRRSFLGTEWIDALWQVSPALPILACFFAMLGFWGSARFTFHALLTVTSSLDCENLYYRETLVQRLDIHWYSAQRHSDNACLLLLRFCAGSRMPFSMQRDMIRIEAVIAATVRKYDQLGRFSRDTIWVILAHTDVTGAEITAHRIIEGVLAHPSFVALAERCHLAEEHSGMRRLPLVGGISTYALTMNESTDILEAAQEALRQALEAQEPLAVVQ